MKSLHASVHSFLVVTLLFFIMQITPLKADAQTPLAGQWTNAYGSILTITHQNPDGGLAGIYASSTGSTGIYRVTGHYFTNPENGNAALILLIAWNSWDGSTRDPSRFWTSTMSGVCYAEHDRMELLNCLSVSAPFRAIQMDEPGVYPETLVFHKKETEKPPSPQETANKVYKGKQPASPPEGEWKINPGNSSPYTTLNISPVKKGKYFDMFSGQVTIKGLSQPVGMTGLMAHEAPNHKQSLSLALTNPISINNEPAPFITGFSGLLNVNEKTLKLVTTASRPVDYKNKYAAVRVDESSYSRVELKL